MGITEIDDVMGIARQHMDSLNLIAADPELQHLVRAYFTLLDEGLSGDDDEKLPLTVMPVLSLRNTWLGNIHRKLAMISSLKKLCK